MTDAGTHLGLGGIGVAVTSPTHVSNLSVVTAADGSYSVPGLETGNDYQVCFYLRRDVVEPAAQCYDGQPTTGTSTPVSVTEGSATTGIDAALVTTP